MEAVPSSSPPAGAPTLALVVWMRPDVHELPLPSAVISRLPLPSRWTLLVELVIVSISPVPKPEPGPVSYIHWESTPEPAAPLKSSLNTVDQPDGGAGTASGAVSAPGAESAVNPTCPADVTTAVGAVDAATAEAAGSVAAVNATTGATIMRDTARPPGRQRSMARLKACGTCGDMLVMSRSPLSRSWAKQIGKFPICYLNVTSCFGSVNGTGV